MPDKGKVSAAQLKVGILGMVALCCIALLIFLLTGNMQLFEKRVPLYFFTSNADGLTSGASVNINGIQAGTVNSVGLSGENAPDRIIKIGLQMDSKMLKEVPVDSVASIASGNLLGSTKYVEIDKGRSQETISPGGTLKSANTQEFDQLVKQGFGLLDSLQATVGKINDIVDEIQNGKGTIGKLLVDASLYNTVEGTVSQLQALATTLNSRTGTIGHLINDPTLYNQATVIVSRIDKLTADLEAGQGTAGLILKDPKLYNSLNESVNSLNTILANLNSGKGTVGQLLVSNKLGNQLSTTLTRVDTTLDKVNSGQGTIGQLLVNPQLYDQTNGTVRELHKVLTDIDTNPKKYLTIHLKIF
jgi:phospholipid/cholesterol/gamma-HCH transport system substrate-binding protein